MKKRTTFLMQFTTMAVLLLLSSCSLFNADNFKLIPVQSGEKWGYVDKHGKYVINPQFESAYYFREGLARVCSTNGMYGFINSKGKYVIDAQYKDATEFSEGLAFVVMDGDYPTCIDKSSKTVFVAKQVKAVSQFTEGFAAFVNNDGKAGYMDKSGKTVINPQFDVADVFREGMARVCKDGKWGYINTKGDVIINFQFEDAYSFSEGLALVGNGEKYGYIDKNGQFVINPQFEKAFSFVNDMAYIESGDQAGFIDKKGDMVINPQFEYATSFNDGMAAIEQNDSWGYIDTKGKLVINPQFEDAEQFFNNIAFVESASKWGIIDKKGKYIVNPQFDMILPYYSQSSKVEGVISDYYNASAFVNKFFEKAAEDKFDGVNDSTTLGKIADMTLYGSTLKAEDKFTAACTPEQEFTEDISCDKTFFYFTNPIYKVVTTYDNFWGYIYASGTTRNYNLNEKPYAMAYEFVLDGDASDKGSAIARAMKDKIEQKYNLKMSLHKGSYSVLRDGKMSFVITYNATSLKFYVGFDKAKLQTLIEANQDKLDADND